MLKTQKIKAIDPETWTYIGDLEVITEVKGCDTCMYACLKEYEVGGLVKERWAELYCGFHDIECGHTDYCSWWEKR